MLSLLRSIVQRQSTITQLKEEVVELRNNFKASQDTIIEMARLIQNQTQLIYNLKFRLENAEKTIESITAGIANSMVGQITDQTKAATSNYSYKKSSKES